MVVWRGGGAAAAPPMPATIAIQPPPRLRQRPPLRPLGRKAAPRGAADATRPLQHCGLTLAPADGSKRDATNAANCFSLSDCRMPRLHIWAAGPSFADVAQRTRHNNLTFGLHGRPTDCTAIEIHKITQKNFGAAQPAVRPVSSTWRAVDFDLL